MWLLLCHLLMIGRAPGARTLSVPAAFSGSEALGVTVPIAHLLNSVQTQRRPDPACGKTPIVEIAQALGVGRMSVSRALKKHQIEQSS